MVAGYIDALPPPSYVERNYDATFKQRSRRPSVHAPAPSIPEEDVSVSAPPRLRRGSKCSDSMMQGGECEPYAPSAPPSAPPLRRGPRKTRSTSVTSDVSLFGPAHALATLAPTSARERNMSLPDTSALDPPRIPFSARAAVRRQPESLCAVIEEGRQLEQEANERLARVKNRILREETAREARAATEAARHRREQRASEVKADLERRHGKELIAVLATVPRASHDEVRALSETFNAHIEEHFGLVGPASASRLFKLMLVPNGGVGNDMPVRDGSITFHDFGRVVRQELRLSTSHEELLSLWKALDDDGNGLVDQGEFLRFIRFGGAETNLRTSARHAAGAPAAAEAAEAARVHATNSALAARRSRSKCGERVRRRRPYVPRCAR